MKGELHDTRYDMLMEGDTKLTVQEVKAGWHFCQEWDSLLIGPGMGEFDNRPDKGECLCGLKVDYDKETS